MTVRDSQNRLIAERTLDSGDLSTWSANFGALKAGEYKVTAVAFAGDDNPSEQVTTRLLVAAAPGGDTPGGDTPGGGDQPAGDNQSGGTIEPAGTVEDVSDTSPDGATSAAGSADGSDGGSSDSSPGTLASTGAETRGLLTVIAGLFAAGLAAWVCVARRRRTRRLSFTPISDA